MWEAKAAFKAAPPAARSECGFAKLQPEQRFLSNWDMPIRIVMRF
jgi:hypothetical protein